MPYLFDRFSGYVLFGGFGWLAYDASQRRDSLDVKVFIILAIFYNPFFGIPVPHIMQVIINILIVIGMTLNILFSQDNPYEDYKKKDDR